jgi:hypothetical protein
MRKLTLVFSFLATVNAFAWGPTGHRVVGEISERFLDSKVRIRVYEILGNQSMSRVSNWSDEIRSEPNTYSYTFPWHYTDWKDEDHDHSEAESSGKLLTAIHQQLAILSNPNSSHSEKSFALKFVIHLVGDLHQPLHVGNGLDQGGNKCRIIFHGRPMNLHALWDEGMIEFTKLSYTELSDHVSQGKNPLQRATWREGTVLDWALESKNLRSKIYPAEVKPSVAPMSVKQYCRSDITVATEDMPMLAFEYSYKFMPIIEERLYQAGLRLAVLLNKALK